MKEKPLEIVQSLGHHFGGALSEPLDALSNIRQELSEKQASDRYRFIREIAEGGLKKVSLEEDELTHRQVAVSVLKAGQPEEEVLRFINEAYITARIEHNNNVPLYDFGLRNESFYFATKYLEGQNFQQYLAKDKPLTERLNIFIEICHAVSFAHSKGIVHLDLKPSNVQVSPHGEVTVFDWGLARDLISEDSLDVFFEEKFAGSPGFTAVEQILCDNERINEQTDIYSLGAILFQILVGQIPWDSADPQKVLKDTLEGDESLLRQQLIKAKAPNSLISVCLKSLSRQQELRYNSCEELRLEVESYLNGFATRAEDASYFKMLYLLVKRHKLPFFLTILFAMIIMSVFSIYQGRLQEEKVKIAQLNKSKASVLYNRAKVNYDKFNLAYADRDITESLSLDVTERALRLQADVFLVKGEYLKSLATFKRLEDLSGKYNRAHEVLKEIDWHSSEDKFMLLTDKLLQKHLPGVVLFMVKHKYGQLGSLEEKMSLAKKLLLTMNGANLKFSFEQKNGLLTFKSDSQLSRMIPLVDLPLREIDASFGVCYSIEALRGMKTLRRLNLTGTYVEDLTPLKGMNLDYLNISNTCVVELKPLGHSKIKLLDIRGQKLKYLTNLLNQQNIQKVILDESKYTSYRDRRELKVLKQQDRIVYE